MKGFLKKQINRTNRNLLFWSVLGGSGPAFFAFLVLLGTLMGTENGGPSAADREMLTASMTCLCVPIGIFGLGLVNAIQRALNPMSHPIVKAIAASGQPSADPLVQVEPLFRLSGPIQDPSNPYLTPATTPKLEIYRTTLLGSLLFTVVLGQIIAVVRAVINRGRDRGTGPKRTGLNGEELGQAIEQINAQIPADARGPIAVGQDWVFIPTHFGAKLIRAQDVVWAYRVSENPSMKAAWNTRHRVNVHDQTGQIAIVTYGVGDKNMDRATEAIKQIQGAAPWAIIGYTDAVDTLWSKQRADVIDTIKRRRQMTRTR